MGPSLPRVMHIINYNCSFVSCELWEKCCDQNFQAVTTVPTVANNNVCFVMQLMYLL